ncbi:hypothetical protein HELRODRAFT_179365 [Helobdella robusta]|uniref:Pcf11 Clp1-ID domain-containing protein n=1 Tax=Helobdella robusta TaxID=6412 RepID=T1FEL9_HELRO|nr:hypothetical protein HELRODRAFT_179365 [Helobdella robusta]ESN95587.1 hypothetical protein HELRODRAFT_179365 [Helobdella robusta]
MESLKGIVTASSSDSALSQSTSATLNHGRPASRLSGPPLKIPKPMPTSSETAPIAKDKMKEEVAPTKPEKDSNVILETQELQVTIKLEKKKKKKLKNKNLPASETSSATQLSNHLIPADKNFDMNPVVTTAHLQTAQAAPPVKTKKRKSSDKVSKLDPRTKKKMTEASPLKKNKRPLKDKDNDDFMDMSPEKKLALARQINSNLFEKLNKGDDVNKVSASATVICAGESLKVADGSNNNCADGGDEVSTKDETPKMSEDLRKLFGTEDKDLRLRPPPQPPMMLLSPTIPCTQASGWADFKASHPTDFPQVKSSPLANSLSQNNRQFFTNNRDPRKNLLNRKKALLPTPDVLESNSNDSQPGTIMPLESFELLNVMKRDIAMEAERLRKISCDTSNSTPVVSASPALSSVAPVPDRGQPGFKKGSSFMNDPANFAAPSSWRRGSPDTMMTNNKNIINSDNINNNNNVNINKPVSGNAFKSFTRTLLPAPPKLNPLNRYNRPFENEDAFSYNADGCLQQNKYSDREILDYNHFGPQREPHYVEQQPQHVDRQPQQRQMKPQLKVQPVPQQKTLQQHHQVFDHHHKHHLLAGEYSKAEDERNQQQPQQQQKHQQTQLTTTLTSKPLLPAPLLNLLNIPPNRHSPPSTLYSNPADLPTPSSAVRNSNSPNQSNFARNTNSPIIQSSLTKQPTANESSSIDVQSLLSKLLASGIIGTSRPTQNSIDDTSNNNNDNNSNNNNNNIIISNTTTTNNNNNDDDDGGDDGNDSTKKKTANTTVPSVFPAIKKTQTVVADDVDKVEPTPDLTDFKIESLKGKYKEVVSSLYTGLQCSSCAIRFPTTSSSTSSSAQLSTAEAKKRYNSHLDWHFNMNKIEKTGSKSLKYRSWYPDLMEWIQLNDNNIVTSDYKPTDTNTNNSTAATTSLTNAPSSEASKPQESKSLSVVIGATASDSAAAANADCITSPVVSDDHPANNKCFVCHETFDRVWNDDREAWCLKEALTKHDKLFHPLCLIDFKEDALTGERAPNLIDHQQSTDESIVNDNENNCDNNNDDDDDDDNKDNDINMDDDKLESNDDVDNDRGAINIKSEAAIKVECHKDDEKNDLYTTNNNNDDDDDGAGEGNIDNDDRELKSEFLVKQEGDNLAGDGDDIATAAAADDDNNNDDDENRSHHDEDEPMDHDETATMTM